MPWFKVDDSFESHPKVKSIPKAKAVRVRAVGLWTLAGCWCGSQLTDGFVPTYMLEEFGGGSSEAHHLVTSGLWSVVEGGFQFNDWNDWQPTKAAVESERAAARERMRLARERKKGTRSGEVRPNNSERSEGVRGTSSTPRSVTPTRPDPTRPVDTDAYASVARAPRSEPDGFERFEEFWDTYGKKRDRKAAEAKWRLALKKPNVTADLLIHAAAEYVLYERTYNEGGRYVVDPTRWLNGERWRDEQVVRAPQQTNVQRHLDLVRELEQQGGALPQIGDGR